MCYYILHIFPMLGLEHYLKKKLWTCLPIFKTDQQTFEIWGKRQLGLQITGWLTITQIKEQSIFVMRSRGISRKSAMWHFQFSIWLKSSIRKVHFAETPPESDQWFLSYSTWKIFKTIENQRNAFLSLAESHNQCSWLPTDPAWSQHICFIPILFWVEIVKPNNWLKSCQLVYKIKTNRWPAQIIPIGI